MIISLDAEKTFDKIQHPFIVKVQDRSGIQSLYLNIIKIRGGPSGKKKGLSKCGRVMNKLLCVVNV
jgi:hypothetical protein